MAYYMNLLLVIIVLLECVESDLASLEKIRDLESRIDIVEMMTKVSEYKLLKKIQEQEQKIANSSTSSLFLKEVQKVRELEGRVDQLENEITVERNLREDWETKYEHLKKSFVSLKHHLSEEKKFRKRTELALTTMLESEERRQADYLELTEFLENRFDAIYEMTAALNANFTSASLFISEVKQMYERFLSQAEIKMADMTQTVLSLDETYRKQAAPPTDCKQLYDAGVRRDGVYTINPDINTGRPFEVYCEMTSGGWTVIQRRTSNEVDFYLPWDKYAKGFGYLTGSHWVGLNAIHRLTSEPTELYMRLVDNSGNTVFTVYQNFSVSGEKDSFTMHVSSENSASNFTFPDDFTYHDGSKFSTYDRDNDILRGSCARLRFGGWWYLNCYRFNLNGKHGVRSSEGIAIWDDTGKKYHYYDETVMMIRRL